MQIDIIVFQFLMQMWWLIGSAPDFCGRGPGFESGIYHYAPDALQEHCEIKQKISWQRGKPTHEAKEDLKKKKKLLAESGYHMSKVSITELHNRYLYLPLYMYSPIQLLWVQSYSNLEGIFEIFKFAFLGLDVLKQSNLRNFLSISAESGYF